MNKIIKFPMLALTAAAMTLGFASCSDNNDPTPDDSSAKDAKFEAIAKQYLANTVNITYQNLADKTELLVDQLKALAPTRLMPTCGLHAKHSSRLALGGRRARLSFLALPVISASTRTSTLGLWTLTVFSWR